MVNLIHNLSMEITFKKMVSTDLSIHYFIHFFQIIIVLSSLIMATVTTLLLIKVFAMVHTS